MSMLIGLVIINFALEIIVLDKENDATGNNGHDNYSGWLFVPVMMAIITAACF